MVNRILLVLKVKNLTASKFADEIGVQRSSISHILSGRNLPSLDLVQKVLKTYPEISSEWLLNGIGPMSKPQSTDLFSSESAEIVKIKPVEVGLFDDFPDQNDAESVVNQIDKVQNSVNDSALDSKIADRDEIKSQIINSEANKVYDESAVNYGKIIPDSASKSEIPKSEFENLSNNDKKIEKIVIFYNNKTFREYFPE